MSKQPTRVTVNGKAHARIVEARLTLADFLRHELGLTGTHLGCEHGVCGACTVLVDGHSTRSCLMFAVQANGCEVTTVEGLTPDGGLSGNLCRCTGYEHIVRAVRAMAAKR